MSHVAADAVFSAINLGADILMLASNAKGEWKWEFAVVSNMDAQECIWARIKARGNREYAVIKTTEKKEGYGIRYFKVKHKKYQ